MSLGCLREAFKTPPNRTTQHVLKIGNGLGDDLKVLSLIFSPNRIVEELVIKTQHALPRWGFNINPCNGNSNDNYCCTNLYTVDHPT
ncbi:hypothetical protein BDZ94DRAFT_1257584 [Collybia nuda]|uniref:Uncharacterized protein n=1 Tax=Collybia nuda TaxID=64659 RepID=A0A9P5Y5U0_9AGAR|nr:hypothetical protein BDZ94DRAFT_1257584 [Collybia nuda]